VSEQLRQNGYIRADGASCGEPAGDLELFKLGAATLRQLAHAGIVPRRDYGEHAGARPDALLISRDDAGRPSVRLVVEFKDAGRLARAGAGAAVAGKVASDYCAPLGCPLAAISDGETACWVAVDPATASWRFVEREDGYPLDTPVDLGDEGRDEVAATVERVRRELNPTTRRLERSAAVDPTRLAEQTWQAIWLASGENPERCLESFVEVLLFKFLSDLGILDRDRTGRATSFAHVADLPPEESLSYYCDVVRPRIEHLFPAGVEETPVIGGLALAPGNRDHSLLFAEILGNFRDAGPLRRIDPEFKSRIFERFLKKNISRKNWGQFFTPRNVVKAIVEMSGIERLAPGETVADPFCGVGGFLLEPLIHKRPHDFRSEAAEALRYLGFDRDRKAVSLAKANMLIHLSEVLEGDPGAPAKLSSVVNETFETKDNSIAGSLTCTPREEWDLVMTNPPYVVTGTAAQRRILSRDPKFARYYSVPGSGVENLCLQMVIAGLRPVRRAFVIVPDGLLLRHSEEALKRHLLRTCRLEAVISLPPDTFYSTPKKTYVLVFSKKQVPGNAQAHGVLTYLIGETGETRDARRFPIEANDLPALVSAFRKFQADPGAFSGESPAERLDDPRARVEPIEAFAPERHWLVDRWRPEEERRALGLLDPVEAIAPPALAERLREVSDSLRELGAMVEETSEVERPLRLATASLGDRARFRLSIGKRVLKQDLFGKPPGPIPLYSANVTEPFGHVHDSNLEDFSHPSVLWGIDGDFQLAVKEAGVEFATTDHCGRIEILDGRIDPGYCRAALAGARAHGFDRTLRPSLRRVRELGVEIPIGPDGEPDRAAQRALAAAYDSVVGSLADAAKQLGSLAGLQLDLTEGLMNSGDRADNGRDVRDRLSAAHTG